MWSYWSRLTLGLTQSLADTATTRAKPLSDLYPRWYGTRELFLHHRDPYGVDVSHEIQIAFYGRLLDASRPGEPRDQQRFAYPLYVVFLLAPFIHMEFHSVQLIFHWLLAAATVGSAALWQRFVRLSFSWTAFATLLAMLLGSVAVTEGLSILQLGLLVSCFISAAAVCAASGQLFLSGAFLALSTIKPQLAVVPIGWFALWALGDWRHRRPLLAGLAITLGALILASEYLLQGWLWRYPDALRAYADYFGDRSLLMVLLPSVLAWPVTAIVLVTAFRFCWRARRQPADSVYFATSLAFALALTVSIIPTVVSPFNQVLLLPLVLLLVRYWNDLWPANALTRFAMVAFCGCVFLPWLMTLTLALLPSTPQTPWPLHLRLGPLLTSLAFPCAAFIVPMVMRRVHDSTLVLTRATSSPVKLS